MNNNFDGFSQAEVSVDTNTCEEKKTFDSIFKSKSRKKKASKKVKKLLAITDKKLNKHAKKIRHLSREVKRLNNEIICLKKESAYNLLAELETCDDISERKKIIAKFMKKEGVL